MIDGRFSLWYNGSMDELIRSVHGIHIFQSDIVRFEKFVRKEIREDGKEHNIWIGSTQTRNGDVPYGLFLLGGKTRRAHRAAWMIYRGEIPPETPHVLHHCDIGVCVKIECLWLGTHRDNVQDCIYKRRYGNIVLTEQDIFDILEYFTDNPLADKDIVAVEYKISTNHLRRILNGQRWKHLHR